MQAAKEAEMKSRLRELERNKITDVRQELSSAESNGSNKQTETLQRELLEITAVKEAEVGNLQEELIFVKKILRMPKEIKRGSRMTWNHTKGGSPSLILP